MNSKENFKESYIYACMILGLAGTMVGLFTMSNSIIDIVISVLLSCMLFVGFLMATLKFLGDRIRVS